MWQLTICALYVILESCKVVGGGGVVFSSPSVGERKQTFDVGIMFVTTHFVPVGIFGGEGVVGSSSHKSRWSDCSLILSSTIVYFLFPNRR